MPEARKPATGANRSRSLDRARRAPNDEFYTRLPDIENEMQYYQRHFRGKTVFCNCDDPYVSNFFKYFFLKFDALGLKKLIATCYKSEDLYAFSKEDSDRAASAWYEGGQDETALDVDKLPHKLLKGNGDFRSAECKAFLKEADVVCTNPPFSLFREYVAQLVEHKKKFLIIGNMNALSYKEIFPLIRENKLWLGRNHVKEFNAQDGTIKKFGNVRWFTNFPNKNRNDEIALYKKYSSKEYPKYDNYDAINVDKVADIPCDYDGAIGVPISFLEKYNPKQFNILGLSASAGYDKNIVGLPFLGNRDARCLINKENKYARIFIRKIK